MASRQQIEQALINADKAGDVEAAKKLAGALKNYKETDKKDDNQNSSLLNNATMMARGATPVVAGATAGGIAGLPFGPAGTLTGTMVGGMGLPLADAAAQGYNYLNPFDQYDVGMPSEAVKGWMNKISPEPQTTEDRMYEAGGAALGGALTGVSAAKAASQLPNALSKSAEFLATAPKAQIGVSAPSAMTSEYVTEKTDNPLLGMAAGVGVGAGAGMLTPKTKPAIPTRQAIKEGAKNQYSIAKNSGVSVSKDSVRGLVDDLDTNINEAGFLKGLHPKADSVMKELKQQAFESKDISEMERLRRLALGVAKSTDPDEARIGGIMVGEISDYMDNIPTSALTGTGDPQVAANALRNARSAWKKNIKSELMEDIVEKAKNQNGANYTNAGFETALRQKMKQVANNKKLFKLFSQDEQDAILKIVRGTKGQNILRLVGKLAPTGNISAAISSGLGYAAFGAPGAVALPVAGFTARDAATRMGVNKFNYLDDMIRLGALPKKQSVTLPLATRGLLSSAQ